MIINDLYHFFRSFACLFEDQINFDSHLFLNPSKSRTVVFDIFFFSHNLRLKITSKFLEFCKNESYIVLKIFTPFFLEFLFFLYFFECAILSKNIFCVPYLFVHFLFYFVVIS